MTRFLLSSDHPWSLYLWGLYADQGYALGSGSPGFKHFIKNHTPGCCRVPQFTRDPKEGYILEFESDSALTFFLLCTSCK